MKYGNGVEQQIDDLRKEIRDDIQKDIRYQYFLDIVIFTLLTTVVDKDMAGYCGVTAGICAIVWLCKLLLSIDK